MNDNEFKEICPTCDGDGKLATSHRFRCYSCKGVGYIYAKDKYDKAIEGEKETMRNIDRSVRVNEYRRMG